MPYIPQQDRHRFAGPITDLHRIVHDTGVTNGELNYLLTRVALIYLERHGISYNTLSDVVKAFECAKLEFYRRHVAPYEDVKRAQNGDVP